jgi:hypothetical protein
MNIFGTFSESTYTETSCSTGEITTDPIANGSLLYPVRVEDGSALDATGYNGQDYGANITKRYGAEGTFYGEPGYNTLTSEDIWPWPNEDRIKAQMATDSDRGFAGYISPFGSPATLTSYIWEYLGNEIPSNIYGTGSCNNNGTCESGEDSTSCPNDCSGGTDDGSEPDDGSGSNDSGNGSGSSGCFIDHLAKIR